ncbi:MAG: hypothetical protein KGI60_04340, partial [Patescibacteria group bacterium]|nr:hypothetical protein [Patescibacteria group bacterium]
MEFVPFHNVGSERWESFCRESDSAWFRHTESWLAFCSALDPLNENLSFGVFDGDEMLAAVPLMRQPISESGGLFEFLTAGTPVVFPATKNGLSDREKEKILISVFEEIDRIAKLKNVAHARFFIDPLSKSYLENSSRINALTSFGFRDVSMTTNIIDLGLSEDALFGRIRKGFRYDIRKIAKNNFSVDFFGADNITDDLFREYKNIYFSAAGKEVGSPLRWENTLRFIRDGNGILAMEKDASGKYISGIVVLGYKNKAYYAFGATAADFKGVNGISHLLQWEMIRYLKEHHFSHYEL